MLQIQLKQTHLPNKSKNEFSFFDGLDTNIQTQGKNKRQTNTKKTQTED